jgi:hypothetical protein
LKRLINICGTGRSGSTVMDLIIGSLDETMSLGEINAYYYPYRTHHITPLCSCGKEDCVIFNGIKKLSRKNFISKIFKKNEIKSLIDSSKSLLWIYENKKYLENENITIFNIVLIKEFKFYAHSIWKRGGDIKLAYKKYTSYYNMLINSGISYCLINQNQLINNKENVSKIINNYTGLSIKIENFDFWNYEHHYFFGSPSAKNQISSKRKQKVREFEELFLKEFDSFIDYKKENALNELKNNLKDRESKNLSPNTKFKIWYLLKKLKTSLISFYTIYNEKRK